MKKITLMILFLIGLNANSQTILSEGFETSLNWGVVNLSTDANVGWSRVTSGSFPTCSPFAGTGMAKFGSFNISGTTSSYELNSPAMTFTGGSYRFKINMFKDNGYASSNDHIDVYYNTTSGSSGGTIIGSIGRYGASNGWNNYTFAIPGTPTGSGYISILATSEYGNNIYIDNVLIENIPSCAEPTSLLTSAVTSSGATVSWTAPNVAPANGYEYYITTSSTPPTAGTVGTGSIAAGVITKSVTGLNSATTYYFYVRSICSASNSSPWSDSVTFLTSCVALTSFSENFDAAVAYPVCWARVGTSGNSNVQASSAATSSPNVLYIYSTSGSQAVVTTPAVSNLGAGTNRFKFNMRGNFTAGEDLEIGYLTNPTDDTSFISLGSVTAASLVFTQYTFTPPAGAYTNYPAIRPTGTNGYSILIDNFVWEPIPTCAEVTLPVASAITSTTATISWTAPASAPANGYAYYISTSPTAPTNATVPTGSVGAGITTANLSALMPATKYYFWIRSTCSVSDSSPWSNISSFTSLCVPVNTFPWTENFDTLSTLGTSNFPPCWYKENGDWSTSDATIYNTPRSGANYLRDSYYAVDEYIWSPGFSLNAGTSYDFSYWTQGDGGTGWTVDTYVGTAQLSTSGTPTQLGTTYSYPGTGTLSIQNYYKIKNTFIPTTTGVYYFALKVNQPSFSPNFVAFDDFNLNLTPSCLEPTALSSSTITTTSATISWTASSSAANGYDYYISTSSTTPTTATVPTGSLGSGITTKALSALTTSTTYYFWVRSKCSASVTSDWSASGSFTTLCSSASVPYAINFESTAVGSIPVCTEVINEGTGNLWKVVNAPGNGFTNKCLKYNYNSSSDANVWFYTNAINLVGGTSYTVAYKYGNDSTTYTENLKVAFGTAKTSSSMTNSIGDYPGINGATPSTASVIITPATTGLYYIGFQAYSIADQFGLYVDDITIDTVLSTSNFNDLGFSFYPNPVTSILTLNYSKNISNISVFNLLGQEVIVKSVNATQSQIDMSNLASGTYLVKVISEGLQKVIKISKK